MFVIPTAGSSVPDPDRGDFLPAEGRDVDEKQYWYRRLEDGDVIESTPVITEEHTDDSTL